MVITIFCFVYTVSNSHLQQKFQRWRNDNISFDCVIKPHCSDKNIEEKKNNNKKPLVKHVTRQNHSVTAKFRMVNKN